MGHNREYLVFSVWFVLVSSSLSAGCRDVNERTAVR